MVKTNFLDGQVAVVVGGGGGIGSAIALDLSDRGALVVAVDPGVGVEGEALGETTAEETAELISQRGGTAIASTVSVTNLDALNSLFQDIVRDHGAIDIVVHAAGILRFASLVDASNEDWTSVFDVHFEGYLNILSCVLPRMARAGRGRVVGLTSGSGLARTSPGNVAYGVAKRAMASLTWELGPSLPSDLRVTSLSPIAATRMVRASIEASSGRPRDASPGAVDLSAMPQPNDMARAATFLVRDEATWSNGQVFFSTGTEHSVMDRPQLVECVLTEGAVDFAGALATLVSEVFAPAEESQRTGGGSNSRFGEIFSNPINVGSPSVRSNCLVVSDDDDISMSVSAALSQWGVSAQVVRASTDTTSTMFESVDASLRDSLAQSGSIDSIVVVGDSRLSTAPGENDTWMNVIASHSQVKNSVMLHAAWLRAIARLADESGVPLRSIHLTPALTSSGRTASQAVTQMVRNANDISSLPLDSFSVSLESLDPRDMAPIGSLVARLAVTQDVLTLRGAELVAGRSWIGIKSHPSPLITVSTDRTDIPPWVNEVFQQRLSKTAP